MLTRQEIFTKVVLGLAAQGWEQSVDDSTIGGSCRYRGANGLKCAAGHLIPDKQYNPNWDRGTVLCDNPDILDACNVAPEDAVFLRGLQDIHDYTDGPTAMRQGFRDLDYVWPDGVE